MVVGAQQQPLPQQRERVRGNTSKKWNSLRDAEAKLIEMAKTYYQPIDDNGISITPIDTPIPYEALPLRSKVKQRKANQHLYMHSVCAKREGTAETDDDDDLPFLKRRSETNVTEDSYDSHEEQAPTPAAGGGTDKPATPGKGGLEEAALQQPQQPQEQHVSDAPLVLLHGYMNGAMYFYRNIANLANNYREVYALDLIGCGLSSRRTRLLTKDLKAPKGHSRKSPQATETLFVESIEAWRRATLGANTKIVLAGHSLGGYLAVAYCEKYPQFVHQLQLYSPAGIAHPEWDRIEAYVQGLPFKSRCKTKAARFIFEHGLTPATFIRGAKKTRLPLQNNKGKLMVYDYMKRRIPALSTAEQEALAEYFYRMAALKGAGEYIISRLLTYSSNAKLPLVDRIPRLKIGSVGFLYGISDWMGTDEGVEVMEQCQEVQQSQQEQPPRIDVFEVLDAGHLLMLDDWKGFHGGVLALQQQCPLQHQQQVRHSSDDNNCSEQQEQSDSSESLYPQPVRKLEQKHKIRPLYFEKVDHDYEQNAAKAAANSAELGGDDNTGSLKRWW